VPAGSCHNRRMLLLRSQSFVVEQDILRHLFRVTRTAAPFATPAAVDAAYDEVAEKLRRFERASSVLLVDMRAGPRATAPGSEIEQALARNAAKLREGWRRAALLMGTSVGVLQATRVQKSLQGIHVFSDEDAALAYLLAADP
jgi:hypothetical protein